MRAIGIGIPFMRRRSGAAIDAQAQAHFNRVIADGGLVPSGLSGVNAFFNTIKTIYGTSDVNSAISAAYDPQVLGYKLGAGSGTTLGQAAQKLYAPKDVFGGIGTGNAYWEGSGVNSNFISTPDAAANRFLNNIALWGKIRLQDYNVASTNTLVAKRPFSGNMSYFFGITAGGTLFLRISNDGNQSNANQGATSSVSLTSVATNGQDISVGVFRNSSTGDVIFYYSLDDTNWIQLGTTISTAAVGIFNTNLAVGVGGYSDGGSTITGRIYYMNISATWLGTPSVLFNANQYTGANTWTSTTSEVWTVNSTGAGLADAVQTTAASQPLLLVHSGENYFFSPDASGNNCTSPNAVVNQISGNLEIICNVNITNSNAFNITKIGNYAFYKSTNNSLILNVNGINYTSTAQLSVFGDVFLKVTRESSNGNITFFTSTNGITYTQLGLTISGLSGAMATSTNQIIVCNQAVQSSILAKVYRATISNSIGGAPVIDFNPNQYNPSTSQTQWTSSTGEVWTINTGTAATGYKGVLIDRNIMQGDGIDDTMITSARFNISQPLTVYNSYKVHNTATANGRYTFSTDIRADHNSPTMTIRVNAGVTYSSSVTKTVNVNSLITEVINGASTTIQNNNGLAATGNAGANGTSNQFLELFKAGATISGNITMSTFILSQSANSAGQRTAIYTYIRSINNNAF